MQGHLTAAEANRQLYAQIASDYDAHEECVVDERLRGRLRSALDTALGSIGKTQPAILDACGGSGNASLLLFERGLMPVTLDISPEMLAIFERKAQRRGYQPTIILGDIETFLMEDDHTWDLIVFSSALHHLDRPDRVVLQATRRLNSGGCVITVFDPRKLSMLGRVLRHLDYYLHVALHRRSEFLNKAARRLGIIKGPKHDLDVGVIAERHAITGLDDDALRCQAELEGLRVIIHDRFFEGRFLITRAIYRLARQPTTFSIALQRPMQEPV